MRPLYFCLTVDCERIKAESPPGGPPDWEFAEKTIRGFHRLLQSEGQRCTFFIVPETAGRHRETWPEIESDAFELGLHLHPQSLGDLRHQEYLGAYAEGEQRKIIEYAVEVWSKALGRRPRAFRPGNFSANDCTFKILTELGFTHGSVSAPERNRPDFRAVWAGAEQHVHRAHGAFRLIPGDLDFVEVPMTEDVSRWKSSSLPYELRVEWGDANEHRVTIENALAEMLAAAPRVLSIISLTHNSIDYFSEDSPWAPALRGIIRGVREAAAANDLELIPATIGQIREAFLKNECSDGEGP